MSQNIQCQLCVHREPEKSSQLARDALRFVLILVNEHALVTNAAMSYEGHLIYFRDSI